VKKYVDLILSRLPAESFLHASTSSRHDRLKRNAFPDFAPSISTRRERSITTGLHRIHARSFRCRHSSGGFHAVFPGDRLCGRVHPASLHLSSRSVVHSFQLHAYEQGTRARLIEAEDELRTLRHERDDALQDLNACKDQTCMWVPKADRWEAKAHPCPRLAWLMHSHSHPSSFRTTHN